MFTSLEELQYPNYFSRITLKEANKGFPTSANNGQGLIQNPAYPMKSQNISHSSHNHQSHNRRRDPPYHHYQPYYYQSYPISDYHMTCDLRMKEVGYIHSQWTTLLLLARRTSCNSPLYHYRVILPNGVPYDLNFYPTYLEHAQYIYIGNNSYRVNLVSNRYGGGWID